MCGTRISPVASWTGAALPMTVATLVALDSERTTCSSDQVTPLSLEDFITKSVQAKSEHVIILASAKAKRRPDFK